LRGGGGRGDACARRHGVRSGWVYGGRRAAAALTVLAAAAAAAPSPRASAPTRRAVCLCPHTQAAATEHQQPQQQQHARHVPRGLRPSHPSHAPLLDDDAGHGPPGRGRPPPAASPRAHPCVGARRTQMQKCTPQLRSARHRLAIKYWLPTCNASGFNRLAGKSLFILHFALY
jgi:hypothetical protein